MGSTWLVAVTPELGPLLASARMAGWPQERVVALVSAPPAASVLELLRDWVRCAVARGSLGPHDLVLCAAADRAWVRAGPEAVAAAWRALGSPPLVRAADQAERRCSCAGTAAALQADSPSWAVDSGQVLFARTTGVADKAPAKAAVVHLCDDPGPSSLNPALEVDVVVARFAEDVAVFLPDVVRALRPRRVVVYDKGAGAGAPPLRWPASAGSPPEIIHLPNLGREGHTYVEHVLRTAPQDLADVTVCLPGSVAHDGHKAKLARRLVINPLAGAQDSAVWRGLVPFCNSEWACRDPSNAALQAPGAAKLTPSPTWAANLGEWAAAVLGLRLPPDAVVPCDLGGVVALPRASVLAWPRTAWSSLHKELAVSSNPAAGHYVERLWGLLAAGPTPRLPRVVWLLWLQGWDAAPQLVRGVRATWEALNPGWCVVPLDAPALRRAVGDDAFPPGAHPAAVSDMARLLLLAKFGGVWADATMACFRPLDEWVQAAMAASPGGLWMHRGARLAPASWLIVAVPGSSLGAAWLAAARAHWAAAPPVYEYFWMDRALSRVLAARADLRDAWLAVPSRSVDGPGEAHCLGGRVHAPPCAATLAAIRAARPFGLKLCHRGPYPPACNGRSVIADALAGVGAGRGRSTTPFHDPPRYDAGSLSSPSAYFASATIPVVAAQ